jgi:streptogramin lyase
LHPEQTEAFDRASGKTVRSIDVTAHAGTAFDGRHLFQLAEDRIQKIDPKAGRVLATIPAPAGGGDSGLAWAEGTLWLGQYRDRKVHQIEPKQERPFAPPRPTASS